MVNTLSSEDLLCIHKYEELINKFLAKDINAKRFADMFLNYRFEDNHWMNGHINVLAGSILDTFFLDVDEFNPEDLYDPKDKFNINEYELKNRAEKTLKKLKDLKLGYFEH